MNSKRREATGGGHGLGKFHFCCFKTVIPAATTLSSAARGDAGERLSQPHTRRIVVKKYRDKLYGALRETSESSRGRPASQSRKSALASENSKCNKGGQVV